MMATRVEDWAVDEAIIFIDEEESAIETGGCAL